VGRALRLTQVVALDALYFSGIWRVLDPALGGVGAVLALDRIFPPWSDPFRPDRERAADPGYIDSVVTYLRRRKIDIVSVDELHRRLSRREFDRRFVCLTLDGAYRDHYEVAWPVFRKHGAPFTLFVPTGFPDGIADLWWLAIPAVIARSATVSMVADGREQHFANVTVSDKRYLHGELMRWLMVRERNEEIVAFVRDLAARYDVDMAAMRRRLCMTWGQIGELAKNPLVTIGAQSVSHPVMTKVTAQQLDRELRMSRSVIESAIGISPTHFAFPFGQAATAGPREFQAARDAGYLTAMTLQQGVLQSSHAGSLTALPRLALDVAPQRARRMKVLMSGAPSAIRELFRRG
jgi:peptidoglycan/xylan/chitin deacetylase (PgdA/CDA1 family)